VVGYICDSEGRYPDVFKVVKILEWLFLNDIITARVFISVCVYFRIWIEYFILREDIGAYPLGVRGAFSPKSGLVSRAEDQPGH